MDSENQDGSDVNAKVSDSAYSTSGSNSQSRRSQSSKSTNSGSRSSGSSGYGDNPSTSTESSDNNNPVVKRIKEKDVNKKKFKLPDKTPNNVHSELKNKSIPKDDSIEEKEQVNTSEINTLCNENNDEIICFHTSDNSEDRNCKEALPVPNSLSTVHGIPVLTGKEQNNDYLSEGFSCVVSMTDGIIMYATPSISIALGIPLELCIGKQFIEFLHYKDMSTFTSHITTNMDLPFISNIPNNKKFSRATSKCSLFSRLRVNNTATNSQKEKSSYTTYQLQLSYRNMNEADYKGAYLVIHAVIVIPVYTVPNEIMKRPLTFMTRHLAEDSVDYIDSESVPYLGYLPQDIVGKSALELYHPEDLTYLTQIYETIVKEGSYFNKKSYRFLINNGDYVKLETSWSSFINPWSHKLEFVIGHHKVVEGPFNIDIFSSSAETMQNVELNQKTKLLRDNIRRILSEVPPKPKEVSKQLITNLESSHEHQDIRTPENMDIDDETKIEMSQDMDQSFSERDSVMLGGISPHHDYFDSKSSTETPPSYNQLNYNENLQRYFQSDPPVRLSPEDADMEAEKFYDSKPLLLFESGDSAENTSCQSAFSELISPKSPNSRALHLTEAMLSKHNYEMEKMLIKHHRKARSVSKASERERNSEKKKKQQHHNQSHGVKRACSVLWANDGCCKNSKHTHNMETRNNSGHTDNSVQPTTSANLWSVNMSTFGIQSYLNSSQMNMAISQEHVNMGVGTQPFPGMIPMFYVPTPKQEDQVNRQLVHPMQQYIPVPYMVYPPVFGQPIMYTPMQYQQEQRTNTDGDHYSNESPKCKKLKKTTMSPTQAHERKQNEQLEIKEEAAKKLRKFLSTNKCQSKDQSECNGTNEPDGCSTYSSFYSSFLKTDSGNEDSGDGFRKKNAIQAKKSNNKTVVQTSKTKQFPKRTLQPPWNDEVSSEVIYNYQIITKNLDDVLKADHGELKSLKQPQLVNDQLSQLYMDLQLEGLPTHLTLEEGITSSSSSSEEASSNTSKAKRSNRQYSKVLMIYDEDAPFPSPTETT